MIDSQQLATVARRRYRGYLKVFWSRWRDLNPRPLPYQGSALPLSYIGKMSLERKTRLKLATLSLEG